MITPNIAVKMDWLRRIGFEVKASENDSTIAQRSGMHLELTHYTLQVNYGLYEMTNWKELQLIPFKFIIRGYMQQVLGLMPTNEDERKSGIPNPTEGIGFYNELS